MLQSRRTHVNLKSFSTYFVALLRDIHTYAHARKVRMALWRLKNRPKLFATHLRPLAFYTRKKEIIKIALMLWLVNTIKYCIAKHFAHFKFNFLHKSWTSWLKHLISRKSVAINVQNDIFYFILIAAKHRNNIKLCIRKMPTKMSLDSTRSQWVQRTM